TVPALKTARNERSANRTTNRDAATRAARKFIELLGVQSGFASAECRLGLGQPAMAESLQIETPIQRRLILAKPCWVLDFAPVGNFKIHAWPPPIRGDGGDPTMRIRGTFAVPRQSTHVIAPQERSGPQKPVRPRDPVASGERDAAQNRAASHNYFLL